MSGGGFLVKFEVGALPPAVATTQIDRLFTLAGSGQGLKHGAAIACAAWRDRLILWRGEWHGGVS
jgi:hypothetical protein